MSIDLVSIDLEKVKAACKVLGVECDLLIDRAVLNIGIGRYFRVDQCGYVNTNMNLGIEQWPALLVCMSGLQSELAEALSKLHSLHLGDTHDGNNPQSKAMAALAKYDAVMQLTRTPAPDATKDR